MAAKLKSFLKLKIISIQFLDYSSVESIGNSFDQILSKTFSIKVDFGLVDRKRIDHQPAGLKEVMKVMAPFTS